MLSLTRQAQEFIRAHLCPGETAIDATAGNGYDTLFLAQTVGESGTVYAFDIQQQALDNTAALLGQEFQQTVKLLLASHADMASLIPGPQQGNVAAIMFNLGYLPGGDKQQTTLTESTRVALEQSLQLLKQTGVLSVLAYTGHAAGAEEVTQVERFFAEHAAQFQVQLCNGTASRKRSPLLFMAVKQ